MNEYKMVACVVATIAFTSIAITFLNGRQKAAAGVARDVGTPHDRAPA